LFNGRLATLSLSLSLSLSRSLALILTNLLGVVENPPID
jgi:hypothetical protein